MDLNSHITAVVTGGASGLGAAVVDGLLAKGVKVAILDMNAPVEEIGAVFCKTDVTDPESVIAALEQARAENGQ